MFTVIDRTKEVAALKAAYTISVWHGEGRSLFYIYLHDNIIMTFESRSEAESFILNEVARSLV